MQAKWTEFIQEGFEMFGMKLMLPTRMFFFSLLEKCKTLNLHYVFHIGHLSSFSFECLKQYYKKNDF